VIRNRETAARGSRLFRWGLAPFWAKDPTIGNRLINARTETVAAKPALCLRRTLGPVATRLGRANRDVRDRDYRAERSDRPCP